MSHWLASCRFSKQQLGNSAPWCPQNQHELSTVGDPDTGLGADCSNELQGPRDWLSSVYVLRHFEGVWGRDSREVEPLILALKELSRWLATKPDHVIQLLTVGHADIEDLVLELLNTGEPFFTLTPS